MQKATIRDIAARTGFSISTVSKALHNHACIAASTRRKIQEAARQLRYQPNRAARGLRGCQTHCVGVLMPGFQNQFYVDFFTSVERSLARQGYSALLVLARLRGQAELDLVDEMLGRGVDGLVIGSLLGPRARKRIEELVHRRFPVVSYPDFLGIEGMDVVDTPDAEGAAALTRHLLELGHRRIALVTPCLRDFRYEGYRRALEEFGVPFDSSLHVQWWSEPKPTAPPRLRIRSVREPPAEPDVFHQFWRDREEVACLRRHLLAIPDPPTAVFAYQDDMAMAIMHDLRENGYRVPGDISIVGVNDVPQAAYVGLTTLRLPTREIGQAVAELLVGRIGDPSRSPRRGDFHGEVVLRSSAAAPGEIGTRGNRSVLDETEELLSRVI
jgi:LacI family transcriptional regulator